MMYQAYFWLKNFLGKFSREEGQGLVEYALILVLIAIVVIGVLSATGTSIQSIFESISGTLSGEVPVE
jgi:pilus assembly protein Flp/PilA